MNIKKIDINTLNPAEYNPRKDLQQGDKEYEKIKKSIIEFGYIDPIIINFDGTIIGGHQRFKVLKELGYIDVDCVVLDLDKTKEKALNIALNKISGEWDVSLLKDVLKEIMESGDVSLTGFDLIDIQKMMETVDIDDFFKDNETENKSKKTKLIKCSYCGEEFEV